MYVSMKGDIIKKVLPALDDLERALQNRPADDASLVEGVHDAEFFARGSCGFHVFVFPR